MCIERGGVLVILSKIIIICMARPHSSQFLRAQTSWRLDSTNYKSQLFEVVSLYPSRCAVYNAIGGGLEAVEFTLWKWEWLAENCVRVNVGLALELNCLINPPSLLVF